METVNLIIIQKPTEEEIKSKKRKWYGERTIVRLNQGGAYCGQTNISNKLKIPGILHLIYKSYIKFQRRIPSRTIEGMFSTHTLASFICLEFCNYIPLIILNNNLKFLISVDEVRAWARYSRYAGINVITNAFWVDMTRETFTIEAPMESQKIILNLKEFEDEVMRDYEIGRCTGVWAKPYFNE